MISSLVLCLVCRRGFRVRAHLDDNLFGEISHDGAHCIYCKDAGDVRFGEESDFPPDERALFNIKDLSTDEFFRALLGLGTPDEQECRKAALEELLKEQPIRKVHGFDVPNTQRVAVDHLELWDGSRVYLGVSGHGVVVYRIVRPANYTQKALDGNA